MDGSQPGYENVNLSTDTVIGALHTSGCGTASTMAANRPDSTDALEWCRG